MKTDPNARVFPTATPLEYHLGLTKRELFALGAMVGLLFHDGVHCTSTKDETEHERHLARMALRQADAQIAALNESEEGG
jgi:hypothetical protein